MGAWGAGTGAGIAGPLSPLDTSAVVRDLVDYSGRDEVRFGTGWSIDDICGCIGTGEMALMWARSGSGKSTWYLNWIRNTPEVPTLVVNMEMTARRQLEWLTAMTFDLETPGRDIEEVLRAGEEDPRFTEVMSALEQMSDRYPNLHFVTPSRPKAVDLEILLDDIADSTGTKPVRVVIDHLGLVGGTEDGYQGYVKTTADLHSLALAQDVALVVLQQTGRGGGDAGRNDGHLPITFSSGVYSGEQDADWVYGLYRPDRDPKFKRSEYQFENRLDYLNMREAYEKVRGLVVMQVIKNRPFGDVCEEGITFVYDSHSRRYTEIGD